MNYTDIHYPDIADGPGCRVSVFVSGCDLHCPGCFNEAAWDFDGGDPLDGNAVEHVMDLLSKTWIAGLTVLGGEPLDRRNAPGVLALCREAKRRFPDKDVWVYTGYTLGQLAERAHDEPAIDAIAFDDGSPVDVIVDGPFMERFRDVTLAFRGSSNQRVVDMPAYRAALADGLDDSDIKSMM